MTSRNERPIERAPLLTERRLRPLRTRRSAGRPPATGWLAPVFALHPTPHRPTGTGSAA